MPARLVEETMSIQNLSDKQIENLINNYRARGLAEGGKYSLSEARLEQQRRIATDVPIDQIFSRILELSRESADGLMTYGELWDSIYPNRGWKGNYALAIMANILGKVIGYCIDHGFPIVTTLVVRQSPRRLDQRAVDNIFSEVKELGSDVGAQSAESFCEKEAAASKALAAKAR